jgi:hypothetical protein
VICEGGLGYLVGRGEGEEDKERERRKKKNRIEKRK